MEKLREIDLSRINGGGKIGTTITLIDLACQVFFDFSPVGEAISTVKDGLTLDDDFCDAEAFPGQPIADECTCSSCS